MLILFFESILYKDSSNHVKGAPAFSQRFLSDERFRIWQLWQSSACEEESRQKTLCDEIHVPRQRKTKVKGISTQLNSPFGFY
jgi:hypothetical protein